MHFQGQTKIGGPVQVQVLHSRASGLIQWAFKKLITVQFQLEWLPMFKFLFPFNIGSNIRYLVDASQKISEHRMQLVNSDLIYFNSIHERNKILIKIYKQVKNHFLNTWTASTTCLVEVEPTNDFSETCSIVAGTPTSMSLWTAEGHFIC